MDPDHRISRRVRLATAGAVVCLVAAVVAGVAAGTGAPRDRVGLSTGTPSDVTIEDVTPRPQIPSDETTSSDGSSTTTSSSSPSASTTTPRLDLPELDLPPIDLGDLGAIDLPPIDLGGDDDGIARGTLWTIDNPPPLDARYLDPQGPPAVVRGTVRNVHGIGVGGMCVEVISTILDGDRERAALVTDGLGRFSTTIQNGLYRIGVVDCRGAAPGLATTMQHLAVAPGQEGVLDLRVPDGAGLRVTVTHPSGAPRSGWCVQQIHEGVITQLGALGGARTGADGVVVLGGLQPGRSRIVASKDCDWANQQDGAASEYVDLPANVTTDLHLAPWTCTTLAPGHLSCTQD